MNDADALRRALVFRYREPGAVIYRAGYDCELLEWLSDMLYLAMSNLDELRACAEDSL